MENGNIIEKLAALFGQSASVKNVYGEAIHAGEKTIIPVATIAYCLGGGYGEGIKKSKHVQPAESEGGAGPVRAGGSGGGGMMYAKPKGVYEISPNSIRFIPVSGLKNVFVGLLVGLFIRRMFDSRRIRSRDKR